MYKDDCLVEILPEDWTELRDIFTINWPDNSVAWHTVNNYIQWHRKEQNIKNLKIYCLNGNWRSDGFVIVDRYQLFVYTLDLTNEKLRRTLNLIENNKGFTIITYLKRHRSAIDDVISHHRLKIANEINCHLYFMPKEESKKLRLISPNNVVLKPLTVDHAEQINNEWEDKHDGSLFLVKRLIEWNPNIGAFNDRGELVAWCLRLQDGSLGAFNVKPEYKGQGFGNLVIVAMCKILASMQLDAFIFVPESFTCKKLLFERLNFKHWDDGIWLQTLPQDSTYKCTD